MRLKLLTPLGLAALLSGAAHGAGQFQQSTDSSFDAGAYTSAYRSGTGSSVSVQLDYSGRGAGLQLPGGAAWLNASWAYRVPVTVLSTNGSTLTSYQVPLTLNTQALISAGRMRSDGADIRFTASDGTTAAPFALLSGINTAATVIWVQIPSIAASTTTVVYMYYGNPSAASASSLDSTFVLADDFSSPDGTAPDAAKWSSIFTSSNAASVRETRSSLLHYSYGNSLSNGGTSYFGLTSVNSQSYAAGRRYHTSLNATTMGAGQRTAINLCTQVTDCFSTLGFGAGSWVGFTVTHATTAPTYTLQRAAGSGIVTLVANTATTAGMHSVDFLMKSGNYQVLLDGASIASGALTTLTPYIHLEAGSSTSTLKDFNFGTTFVSQWSSPEPAQSAVGAEQGAYLAAGRYDSAVLDSGAAGTRYHFGNWQASVPGASGLGFLARAADASIAAGTWTVVSAGADPGLSGRFFQYESSFTTTDARFTAAVTSVTFAYTSAPPAPTGLGGVALSSTSIVWSWSSSASGQYQPDGFRVLSSTGGLLAALGPSQLSWQQSFLTPNTSYQTSVQAYNFVGSATSGATVQYTLTSPASVTAAQSTGTWYRGGTVFTFTNAAGFGAISSYRYSWTATPGYTFLGSEPQWTSGTLAISTPTSGQYYLHAVPLNAAGTAGAQLDFGPFLYDALAPAVASFSPSSSPWTSAAASVDVGLTDAGGSGLASVQYQWLATSGTPAGGWSSLDTSVSGAAGSVTRVQFGNGAWYLHILVSDTAGTTGYLRAGPYQVDQSSPTGSLAIAGGAFTSTTNVTLNLGYADSVSGVWAVRYRNVPGAFTPYELAAATKAWVLAGGVGVSTVEYQVVDLASNTATFQATVLYSRQSTLVLAPATIFATGESGAETSTAAPAALLTATASGAGISGRAVQFKLLTASGTGTTDGSGNATFSFAAPASSGVYLASATFAGDAAFDSSSSTAALTVLPRSSFLVTPPVSATASSSVTLTATLIDLATTAGLVGKSVAISFRGSTITATTDASGAASAIFAAPASSGAFAYSAAYAGGNVYAPTTNNNTVNVGRRGVLVVGGTANTAVNQPFTVGATLFDLVSASRLAGKTISFRFAASTGTGITDATGIATATFVAASTGTLSYVATFPGDATYGVNSDTNTVNVSLRNTSVAAVALSTTVSSPFTISAVASDSGGGALAGSPMAFYFLGSTVNVTADASGYAQASFTAPASSGAYFYTAYSSGGVFNNASSAVSTVTVVRRTPAAAVPDFATGAGSVFTASATLTDLITSLPLAGRQFAFQFQGSTATGTTDAGGLATATFTAPGSVGGYSLNAAFAGDGTYLPITSTATVTVNTRATTLSALSVAVPASGVFTASATLTESVGSAPVGGKSITFVFMGSVQTAVTNGSGLAVHTFTAPASTGSFSLNVDFLGDALYLAASDTKTVTSTARPLTLQAAGATAASNDVWTATATALDGVSGAPVAGLSLQLTFQAVTSTVVSGGAGVSAATFTAPVSTGTFAWQASYPGDAVWAPATIGAALTVTGRPSQTAALPVSVVANRVFTASATLTDLATGAPLTSKTISFSFQGSTLTSVTNGAGLATRTFLAPASSGTLTYTAWYSGSALIGSSTGTAAVSVVKLPSALTGIDVQTTSNAEFTTHETLTDSGSGAPLAGENVTFIFMGTTVTAATDGAGVAVATFTAPSTSTLTNFTATFAGNGTYQGASDSRVVAVGFRQTATIPFNTSGLAMDPSTFTVKLIDLQAATPLSARSLSINLQSSTRTATTDVNGLAVSSFTLPTSSGVYAINGSFAGESFFVASAGTGTVTVLSRPNLMFGGLSPNDFDRLATLGGLNGGWSLTDSNSFLGVPSRSVNVIFLNSTYTVTTNASGNFNLSALGLVTSTIASSNVMSFVFPGDATYSSSSLNFPVNVVPRYTDLNIGGPTANAGLSFNVDASLINTASGGQGISSRTITFTFLGTTTTAITNGSGFAVGSFVAPMSTGIFTVTASFAGDQTFGATGGSGFVTVINRQAILSSGGWDCGVMLPCAIGSNLSDLVSAVPIVGSTITYTVSGTTYTAVTDSGGNTALTLPAFTSLGNVTIYGFFPGNGAYLSNTSTSTVPVNRRPTLMGVSDLQVQRLDVFQLPAGLQEFFYQPSATGVRGATVTFSFNGATYTARTDTFGTAFATVTAPSALGTYPFSATFLQDSTFTVVSATANIIVGKRDTQLSGSNAQPAFSQVFYPTAQLQDGASPISGATITFTLQGTTQTALTSGVGVASAPFTAPASTGNFILSLSYAGSSLFNASTATASILVDRRLTNLPADNLTSAVLSSFTARAVLADSVSGLPRSGQTIYFAYQGSSAAIVTNALGVASTTFVAPSTSAASYSATYLGDTFYYGSSSTGTLTLSLRASAVIAFDQFPAVSQGFNATAQLKDFETGAAVAGSTLTFTFQASSRTAPTNGAGQATGAFTAPAASGTYAYTAFFPGNSVYLPSTGTANAVTAQRITSLTPSSVNAAENDIFSTQATFVDSVSGLPVSGATVTFVFQSSTRTAFTNAFGVATATYTAPSSSGTYTYTASFAGNGTYTAASAGSSVTVGLRPTSLIVASVGALIGDAWQASGTLIDSGSGQPIAGRSVSLLFSGSTQTFPTTALGVSTAVYGSLSTAGARTIFGSFAGDATYSAASGSGVLTVSSRTTNVTLALPNAFPGEVFLATATLTDVNTGTVVSSQTILVSFQASSAAAVTGAGGFSTAAFLSPVSTGTYSLVATFPSSGAYITSSATGTVTALPRPTGLSVGNATAILFSSFTASASLTDTRLGTAVSGASVAFVFNGATQTVLTSGLGSATTTFAAPVAAGSYPLTASFPGSSTLQSSGGAGTINVTLRPTLTVGTPQSTTSNSLFTVSAQLKDSTTSGSLGGLSLIFLFNGSSQAATTNGSGQGVAGFSAPASSGAYSFSVTYAGGAVYGVSSDTEPVTIGQRPVLISLPSYNSNALSAFNPVATVTDVGSGQPIVGRTVSFVFQNSTETAATNGLGSATTNYFAPAGIGFYPLTAATLADSTYALGYASATVAVQSFSSTITVSNASAFVSQVFIASATLQRTYDSAFLAGSSVVFQLGGTIVVATSNAVGLATAAFAAPASSGSYSFSATFGGDGTYIGVSSTATLTVSPLATTLTSGAIQTVNALSVITATATLTRTVGGAALAGKTIAFAFQGNGSNATTNGSGVATATFTALSSGTWNYTSNFNGDSANAASSTGTAITVNPIASVLVAPAAAANTLDVFTASATLTGAGQPAVGRTVRFFYLGVSSNSLTNASGLATVTYNAGASSGTPQFSATFLADATYLTQSATGTVTVSPRPTGLVSPAVSVFANEFMVANATLTDTLNGLPVNGQPVSFSYLGASSTTQTGATGSAASFYSAGASSGSFTYYSTFTANATYLGSTAGGGAVTVLPRPTSLASVPVTVGVSLPFIATATLSDVRGGGVLAGQSVIFVYMTSSYTAVSNGLGIATAAFLSAGAPTVNSFSATLSSGPTYAGVSSTGTVTVVTRPVTLVAPNPPTLLANGVFTASATLTDPASGGAAIAGRTVTFIYLGVSSSSLTNGAGLATVTYGAGSSSGAYNCSATYLGEATYSAGSATATVTVLPRPTSVSGAAAGPLYTLGVFTASGTLTDTTLSAPVAGQTLSFLYQGTSSNSLTNASGLGTVTYNAGTASGTWSYSVTLSSGPTYIGSSSTATVTLNPRPTLLTAQTTTELTLTTFVASATLQDGLNNNPISGLIVWFNYAGNPQSAATNAQGLATHVYSVGAASGSYTYSATFNPTATYVGQSSTGTLTVTARATVLISTPIAGVFANNVFLASATLNDLTTGAGVAGKTVSFNYKGAIQTAVTNGLGTATTNYAAGASSGAYQYSATFLSDLSYTGQSSTSAVTVNARTTSIAPIAAAGIVNGVFTASGTLTDVVGSTILSGQTLYFQYQGSSGTAVTNGSGLATVSFGAGISSGSYTYSVTLSSGPTYAGTSSTAAVSVTPRPTLLATAAVASAPVNDLFIATATLTDTALGTPVSGRTVTFLYKGASSSSSVTNASGQATVTYNAGASSGPFSYNATFTGDASYAAVSATASVTVVARPTSMAAAAIAGVYANEVITASSTLTDVELAAGLAGQSIVFAYYTGASSASVTGASGLGTVTYPAGSTGTYSFNATLPANAAYAAASSTAGVTVLPRPTVVAASAVASTNANDVFTASATVTDVRLSAAVSGATVWFAYNNGTALSAVTNGSGLATRTFNAGASSGTLSFSATLSSGGVYAGQSSTASVVVVQRASALVSANIAAVPSLGVFTASATLNDSVTGAAIAGKTVSFNYLGALQTAVTNALGSATTNYAAGASSGSYQYAATFVQDATYLGASSTSTVAVNPRPTLAVAAAASSQASVVFTASATLTDVLGSSALAGQTLWFSFGGVSSASLTNASGLATVTYTAPSSSGAYQFSATLSSGPTYAGQSSTATLTVTQRATSLASAAVPQVYASNVFTATATLTDTATSGALAGKTVTFIYLGVSSQSATNASGQATVTYGAGASSGTLSYSATFQGDPTFAFVSSTGSVTILPKPTTTTAYAVASVYANNVFTATAVVSDLILGAGASGQTVSFSYRGTIQGAATAASGQATSNFNAGASSGTFNYSATVSSGPVYGFSSATAAVTVIQRPINAAAAAAATFVNNVFIASATLTDGLTSANVSGRPVTFIYLGVSSISLTNASGLATVSYSAGASSGAPTFSATYLADSLYSSASSTAAVTVSPRPTNLTALTVASTPAIDPFSAAATLTDGLGAGPISGQPVWFVYKGGVSSAATNGSGTASVNFSAGVSSGAYSFSATLSSSSAYSFASSTAGVTVTPRATALSIPLFASIQALGVFTASATLTDVAASGPVAGQTVSFFFNGSTITGTSNGAGLSTAAFTAPASSGTYAVQCSIASNATYLASAATGTVTVASRLTTLAASTASAYALESFISSATLTDSQTLGAVAGRAVSFLFQAVPASGTTSGAGLATGGYAAPASSGAYTYTSTFAGDGTYGSSASGATAVTVLARPTGLASAAPANAFANAVFTATATLTDLRAGGGASGRGVVLTYRTQTRPAVSNGSGVAVATFTAEASTGTYSFAAAWAGDALYASSAAVNLSIVVQPRPMTVAAGVTSGFALGVFTATATLTDAVSTTAVSGRQVVFTYGASSGTATTNASGGASVSFAAGASTGAAAYAATFVADATYAGGSSTAAVTVNPRPTVALASEATSFASAVFTASATLTDVPSGLPLSGKTLSFVFFGTTQTATTDVAGFAGSTFSAPAASGTYILMVSVSTDAIYVGSASTAAVYVLRRPTVTALLSASANALNVFTATATLTDGLNSSSLVGQTMSFVFQGSTQTAVTNVLGQATTTFFAPSGAGAYALDASYAGDALHSPSTAAATVTVNARPATLAAAPATVSALDVFSATGTLTDTGLASPIAGQTLSFAFAAATRTAVTDGAGVAASTFSAPASSGVYAFNASYGGSATYGSTATAAFVTVVQRLTAVTVSSGTADVLSTYLATATLRDVATGAGLAGRTLSFLLNGTTVPAVTDGAGAAHASFTAPAPAGTYPLWVSFAQNATYAASVSSADLFTVTRPVALSTPSATAPALDPITLSSTLTDAGAGTPLAGRTLSFVLNGATQTAVTNGLGVAATNYIASIASGTYVYTVTFAGDTSYSSMTAAGDAVIQPRATAMTAQSLTTIAGAVFVATGTLRDASTGGILAGKTVHIHFIDGNTNQDDFPVTNAFGNASSTFTAPTGTGQFQYIASFDGDQTYGVSLDTGFVQIGLASTMIAADISTIELDTFTFSAKLIDPHAVPISGKTITFTFAGSTRTAVTNAAGVAASTFTAGASSGVYAGGASYAGDSTYAPSAAAINVNVALRGTTLSAVNTAVNVGSPVAVTARVRDSVTSVGISSKTVVFTVFGSTLAAQTDGSGLASASFPPAPSSGVFSIAASFAGDGIYAPSTDSSSATVSRILTAPVPLPAFASPSTSVSLIVKLVSLVDGSGLPGESVQFQLDTATAGVVTDASGQASALFTAPASSGVYSFSTLFAGGTTYAASGSTGTLSVGVRATTLAMTGPSVFASQVFTATATLTDTISAGGVSTATIIFNFNGSASTAASDGFGMAFATFTAPASTGSFALTATFAGGAVYAPSTAAAVAAVSARPVDAAVQPVTVVVGAVFIATASFSDALGGAPIAFSPVVFQLAGGSRAAFTDALGVATASFAAPLSSGVYSLSASYAGLGIEAPASSTAPVTVVRLGALITAGPVDTFLNAPFAARFTLISQASGLPLAGETLQFDFQGGSGSAVTDGAGVAFASFTAPGNIGIYQATATFAGNATYGTAAAAADVAVASRPTSMVIPRVDVSALQVFTATITLIDEPNGLPLAGKSVSFFFQGSTSTMITDVSGVARATFSAPGSTGSYNLDGLFGGTTVYLSTSAFSSVVISSGSGSGGSGGSGGGQGTVLLSSDLTVTVSRVFIASATLTLTSGGAAVAGKNVDFLLAGTTVTGVTNAVGLATAAFTAPATSGTFIMSESFAGDTTFNAAASTSAVFVQPEPTSLILPDILTSSGSIFVATATLTVPATSATLAARSVQFLFQGTTVTAATNGSGVALATFFAPTSSGSFVMQATFAGDPTYALASSSAAVVVQASGGGGGATGGSGGGAPALVIFPAPVTPAVVSQVFTAKAALMDPNLAVGIPSRAFAFVFQGTTATTTTDAFGVAQATFMAPAAFGPSILSAYFIGDSTYVAASATNTVIAGLGLYPADPTGVAVTTQTATAILIGWNAVTESVNGTFMGAEVISYAIERTTDISTGWSSFLNVSSGSPTSLTLSTVTVDTWVRVVAVSREGFRSPGLAAMRLSAFAEPARVFLSNDQAAWVEVAADADKDLTAGNSNRQVVLTTIAAPGYVFAYDMGVFRNGTREDDFVFNNYNGVRLVVSIDRARATAGTSAASVRRPKDGGGLALFFWTGVEWVKLGGVDNARSGQASITTRRPGRFAAGFAPLAGAFSLTLVAPRVFTPNAAKCLGTSLADCNRARFFFEDPQSSEVNIRIFDISGASVRSTVARENSNTLYWDGADDNGKFVKSGVYIYQIETGGKKQTGTIAVAR